MEEFSGKNILMHSNWFVNRDYDYFKDGGKEKMLAVYLNLHKFRLFNPSTLKTDRVFSTSIRELYQQVNFPKRIMSIADVKSMVLELVALGILEVISRMKDASNIPTDSLLKVRDLTYNKGVHFIDVPLDVIQYMLNNKLSYRHISLFLLVSKWVTKVEKKAFFGVNKAADWLGYSNNSILKYITEMNQLGVMASHLKRPKKGRDRYEHYPLYSLKSIDQFKESHRVALNKFSNK